jgi:hypothetical protein
MNARQFNTEAEEAQWWYDNRATLEEALINAMDDGAMRIAEADLDLARRQAREKGLL